MQTLCGTYNSILCVQNICDVFCSGFIIILRLIFLLQLEGRSFIINQTEFYFQDLSVNLFWTPRLSRGFRLHNEPPREFPAGVVFTTLFLQIEILVFFYDLFRRFSLLVVSDPHDQED